MATWQQRCTKCGERTFHKNRGVKYTDESFKAKVECLECGKQIWI